MSEPFTAFSFRVEILLPGATEPLCDAAFAECDGMELRFDVRSLSRGRRPRPAPARRPCLDRPGSRSSAA